MIIIYMAKVVGNVVATRKEDSLVGFKLMIIQKIDSQKHNIGSEEVAADYVGAGIGEYVLVCSGSAVRVQKHNVSIDMAIVGIIDTMDV